MNLLESIALSTDELNQNIKYNNDSLYFSSEWQAFINHQKKQIRHNKNNQFFSDQQLLSKKENHDICKTCSSKIEKALFKTFSPKEKLFYCYIIHKYEPSHKITLLSRKKLAINYCTDIQRICYHPKTQQICTFLGFSTQEQLKQANENKNLKKTSCNKKIYVYQKYIYDLELSTVRQFVPQEQLFYTFFIEKIDKTVEKYCISPSELFGLKNAMNVQRNCFYPGTNIICTFIGFSSMNKLNKALQNHVLINSSVNQKLFKFQNQVFDLKLIFTRYFIPKKELFYIYFVENVDGTVEKYCISPSDLFGIKNASNIQRNCFYPGTNSVYTFVGFSSLKKLKSAIEQTSLKVSAFNQLIYLFQLNEEQIAQTDSSELFISSEVDQVESDSSSCSMQDDDNLGNYDFDIYPNERENYDAKEKDKISTIEDLIDALNDGEDKKAFIPNDEFYYIYFNVNDQFSEKKIFLKRLNQENENIKDIQEGSLKERRKGENKHYIFIGFSQSIERIQCFRALQHKEQNHEIFNLRNLDEEYSSNSEDEFKDMNDKKDEKNINKSSNNHKKARKNKHNKNKLNISSQNLNSQSSSTQNNKDLPKFNKYKKTDLFFNVFVPQDKLSYCFFAETTKPNHQILVQKYENNFCIKNASDIQRFCFYPGTTNIYTFVGFSDKNQMINDISKSSVLSFALDRKIYSYPFTNKNSLIRIAQITKNDKNKLNYTINIDNKKTSEQVIELKEDLEIKHEILDQQNCENNIDLENKEDLANQIFNEDDNKVINNENERENADVKEKDKISTIEDLIDALNDGEDKKTFIPNDEFYYIYFNVNDQFSEKKIFLKRLNQENENIKDIQEGSLKERRKGENKHYIFIGFSQSIERIQCFRALQHKEQNHEIFNLRNLDEEYSSSSEDEKDNNTDIEEDENENFDDLDDDYDDNFEEFENIHRSDEYSLNIIQHIQRNDHIQSKEKIRITK